VLSTRVVVLERASVVVRTVLKRYGNALSEETAFAETTNCDRTRAVLRLDGRFSRLFLTRLLTSLDDELSERRHQYALFQISKRMDWNVHVSSCG
jgi:hypothetical protein